MASVDIIDIRKSYGSQEVIHGVSIGISDGEFVILVGPSGCGKSTLLRMIAGLEPITAGDIRIGERIVNDLPPKDRDIAMVFQSYALYPHKTVFENMGFAVPRKSWILGHICRAIRASCRVVSASASRWDGRSFAIQRSSSSTSRSQISMRN
jgi:multiple sugar transport system ATP-binding protein